MKKLSLFLIFSLSSLLMFSQYKVVQTVEQKESEFVIPFTKYKLDNGLTVILSEDHSDPIVHVDVTYHVGSAREEIGKSGFAHFFEHMMFQGSDNVADEEHFKIVSESGGTLNGTTNRDRTNYFETIPSNQLETALWLEADRMGFLLDSVTQRKFEIQRETVKNERGQNYDNRPYGLASETIARNLYPYGHPYSWLTIGYVEDLNRVDVNDLKNFFLRWYGPNNAVLTIAGDLDQEATMDMIVKYFGSIPRGPEVENMNIPLPVLEADRYVSYTDNYAQVPRILMVWPVPAQYHEDEPALDALAQIIGQGKNSILYKDLVKTQKAAFASAYNSTSELAGEFTLIAQTFPNTALDDVEQVFRDAFVEFEQNGVEEEALERFKADYEKSFIRGLRSVGGFGGKASVLASYETFAGDANYLSKDIARYENVTAEDIMRVYKKYIKGKPAVIVSVLPKKGDFIAAKEDNYIIDSTNYEAPNYGYEGLAYNKATDDFDRSIRPSKGANPVIKVPDYTKYQFKNGIKILQTDYSETPEVIISLSFEGGHYLSAKDPSKAGIANVFAQMMNEGTENYTAEEFSSELKKLGSSISFSSGNESMGIYVQSLEKNLDATLALLEEKLLHPAFKQEDLDRIKRNVLQGIENNKKNPGYIASTVYKKVIYGEDDIRSIPSSGTKESVKRIELDDIRRFYKNVSPSVTDMVIVGDLSKRDIRKKFKFLRKWKGKDVSIPELPQPKDPDRTVLYLVNVDGAAQSQIQIGYPLDIPYDATGEYYKLGLMNYPLGGAFNSRININLREDKGWTYGARSRFSSTKTPGLFTASAGVKKEASDSSIVEFMKEIHDFYQNGIHSDEVVFMKNSIGQSEARKYETPTQKLSLLRRILAYDLDKGFIAEQNRILERLSKQDIDALADKYLDPEKMVIITVGDKAKILDGLKDLGYPIVELDADGEKSISN